ncbi:hypothetical protein ABOB31_24610, partial [Escherichia coli]
VPAYGPQNDVTLKMPAFEWVHVQLHQQKGMISLSPPTICNSAGLGAHQPNRRLRLAAEPQTGRREVSALTDARKTLAYDFFRILRAPLFDNLMTKIP